jgi:hypothetical protein
VELKRETADAFDRYIAGIEARLEPRFHGEHFLWFDDSPDLRQKIRRGDIVVQPVQASGGIVTIKGGLIQDWIGGVFIPGTNLKTVLSVVQDYNRDHEIYKPDVAQAKLRSRKGDDFIVYLRIIKSKFFFTDVLNVENDIRFVPVDAKRVYSLSYSKRIAEVSDPGKSNEHELPVGQDRGFLWRLYGYWFFEERDGGVYISCQSTTLTRDLPFALSKIIGPIIRDVPGESLKASLEQTRTAVLAATGESVNPAR